MGGYNPLMGGISAIDPSLSAGIGSLAGGIGSGLLDLGASALGPLGLLSGLFGGGAGGAGGNATSGNPYSFGPNVTSNPNLSPFSLYINQTGGTGGGASAAAGGGGGGGGGLFGLFGGGGGQGGKASAYGGAGGGNIADVTQNNTLVPPDTVSGLLQPQTMPGINPLSPLGAPSEMPFMPSPLQGGISQNVMLPGGGVGGISPMLALMAGSGAPNEQVTPMPQQSTPEGMSQFMPPFAPHQQLNTSQQMPGYAPQPMMSPMAAQQPMLSQAAISPNLSAFPIFGEPEPLAGNTQAQGIKQDLNDMQGQQVEGQALVNGKLYQPLGGLQAQAQELTGNPAQTAEPKLKLPRQAAMQQKSQQVLTDSQRLINNASEASKTVMDSMNSQLANLSKLRDTMYKNMQDMEDQKQRLLDQINPPQGLQAPQQKHPWKSGLKMAAEVMGVIGASQSPEMAAWYGGQKLKQRELAAKRAAATNAHALDAEKLLRENINNAATHYDSMLNHAEDNIRQTAIDSLHHISEYTKTQLDGMKTGLDASDKAADNELNLAKFELAKQQADLTKRVDENLMAYRERMATSSAINAGAHASEARTRADEFSAKQEAGLYNPDYTNSKMRLNNARADINEANARRLRNAAGGLGSLSAPGSPQGPLPYSQDEIRAELKRRGALP